MLNLNDFKKLAKSQALNARFVVGGGTATQYKQDNGQSGDDYKHNNGAVGFSKHVIRGGTAEKDPA